MQLDTKFVRSQFPAFSEKSLKGLAHFENAGGSYACAPVIDRLSRFYRRRKVQPYGPSKPSAKGGAEMDEARARLAALLGVAQDELHFGPSTTANAYTLSQAFRTVLGPGDAIVVTDQDHEANSGPWRRLEYEGVEIREWKMDPETGHLDPAALDPLLDEHVALVCFPHCSNVIGEINDAAAIVAKVHDAGALVCIDGVSYAPHGLPDIGALGADVYLFSTYKTYGPHQGIMTIRRDLADALPAQSHFFNAGVPTKRFTPAGPDHAQVAACAGIADYVDALYAHHIGKEAGPLDRGAAVHDLMRARETALLGPLLDYLGGRSDIRVLGPGDPARRAPTVAIETRAPGRAVAERMATLKIAADGGDFYAVRALRASGVDPEKGVFRMSFVHYTTEKEVDRLIAALDAVL